MFFNFILTIMYLKKQIAHLSDGLAVMVFKFSINGKKEAR